MTSSVLTKHDRSKDNIQKHQKKMISKNVWVFDTIFEVFVTYSLQPDKIGPQMIYSR